MWFPQCPTSGRVHLERYHNSLGGLIEGYRRGYRYFEVDLLPTRDFQIIGLHDWTWSYPRLFGKDAGDPPATITSLLANARRDVTPLTLPALALFLERHPDSTLVLDAKAEPVWIWKKFIQHLPPSLLARVVPQAYTKGEFFAARDLGFPRVIFATYRTRTPLQDVAALSRFPEFEAMSINHEAFPKGRLGAFLQGTGICILAFTVNSSGAARIAYERGARGYFTDTMLPADVAAVFDE